jgi:hypothetical protein
VAHTGEELRLALACLRELLALVLNFVEQPHIFDRDHRLVGEGREQLDLLWRERSLRDTSHHQHPNGGTLPHEGDGE